MNPKLKTVSIILIFIVLSSNLWAQVRTVPAAEPEQLGELELADFLVEPTYLYTERGVVTGQRESGFGLGNSYLAAKWKLQRTVSGRLQIASFDLLNRPSWSPVTETGLGFVEAYAQLDTAYGRVRAGLVPVIFGLDGATPETQLWFPHHMIYSQRVLGLRDYGLSYSISNDGFFTDVTVHNGEGGKDQDRRLWQTARWGWNGPAGTIIGLSGAVGYYTTTATPQDTKVRVGNFFAGIDLYGVGLAAEATLGEQKSTLIKSQFFNWYVQARHNLGRNWGALLMYEYYDPSNLIREEAIKQGAVGLYLQNETNTSRLSFLYTKNWEEVEQTANDEYRLTWRITSSYLN